MAPYHDPDLCDDTAHRCLVLTHVLGGLVQALDDLTAAGCLDVPVPEDPARAALHREAPLAWHVFSAQLREARELLAREPAEGA